MFNGPVRGGIRIDSAPGSPGAACGVSPIALKATNANRTPSTSMIAGRLASFSPSPAPNDSIGESSNARIVSTRAVVP